MELHTVEIQDGLPLFTPRLIKHEEFNLLLLSKGWKWPRSSNDILSAFTRLRRNNCSCGILTAICHIKQDLYNRFVGLYSFLLKLIPLKMMSKRILTSEKTDLASILEWSSTAAPDTQQNNYTLFSFNTSMCP